MKREEGGDGSRKLTNAGALCYHNLRQVKSEIMDRKTPQPFADDWGMGADVTGHIALHR